MGHIIYLSSMLHRNTILALFFFGGANDEAEVILKEGVRSVEMLHVSIDNTVIGAQAHQEGKKSSLCYTVLRR